MYVFCLQSFITWNQIMSLCIFWGLRPQLDCTMKNCSLNALSAEVLHDTRRFSEQAPILTEVLSTRRFLSSIAGIFHQFPIMGAGGKKPTCKSKTSRIMKKKRSSREKDILIAPKLNMLLFLFMPNGKNGTSLFYVPSSAFNFGLNTIRSWSCFQDHIAKVTSGKLMGDLAYTPGRDQRYCFWKK